MTINQTALGCAHSMLPIQLLQNLGERGRNIKVAIIDGDIDEQHPELVNVDFVKTSISSDVMTTHGTAVCSVICGTNIGLAQQVSIHNFAVFHENQDGQIYGCSERQLAKAIRQAHQQGCDVINISGAGLSVNGRGSDELRQAVKLCEKDGVLLVCAVGNEGMNSESLPAALSSVIAVGACDNKGIPASFNNYGPKLRKKMLLASGVDLPIATKMKAYDIASGSSFAAPVVSAVCALVLNVFQYSPKEQRSRMVREALFSSASVLSFEGRTPALIYRLNIKELVSYVQKNITNQAKKGKKIMQEEQSIKTAYQEGQDVIPQADICTEPSTKIDVPSPTILNLGDVPAPLLNQYVHKPASIQAQSNLDARSIRDQEKIFIICTIGYDFGTEARLDYFTQVMGGSGTPYDPEQMAMHLKEDDNLEQSNALIWTLKIDGIPVYAIEPDNQFAVLQYTRLVEFIHDQEKKGVERVSIAGVVTGEVRLFNGHVVPKLSPVLRGMFNWRSQDLVRLVIGEEQESKQQRDALTNFINRIYYELRNRGSEAHERALNYAATNAYQMKEIFNDAFNEGLFLNCVSAVESPVSRPDSDCWDVVLEFFNPKERLTAAKKLYRYTVDVSDVMPVTVGKLRSWHVY